jgi:isoaspartyl peptidase/L-asparaginase-like protein (Ntn-hydrolase superfamily)
MILMSQGLSVQMECTTAVNNIYKKYPTFSGGLVCVDKEGNHAGAAVNMEFSYSYMSDNMTEVQVVKVA